jgi:hypothetical protein
MALIAPGDPLAVNVLSDFTGPGEIVAALGRAIAANTPMESVWIPAGAAKAGSVELEGQFSTVSVQLLGNNFPTDPGNFYTVTLGGSTFTAADTVSLTFWNPNIPTTGQETVTRTLGAGESATTLATELTALINADPVLLLLGIVASVPSAGVIQISYPSVLPGGPIDGTSPTSKPQQNTTVVLFSKTGSGNETGTVANASLGGTLGSAITTNAIVALATLPRWIKAQFNTLTGGSPSSPVVPWFHGSV